LTVAASSEDLVIAADAITLITDRGASGDSNGAIDAGETITLNIPIMNVSTKKYISTSGFLQSDDDFVAVDASEVVYDEIEPNQVHKVSDNYTFTISPDAPDGHRCRLHLLTWDTDYGKSVKPILVTVYRAGPLSFGSAEVDDDMPGPSDGNGDKVLDAGETIEFRVNVKNEGAPEVSRSTVKLVSQSPHITFNTSQLAYSQLPGGAEKGVRADYDFAVAETGIKDTSVVMAMVSDAECRGHSYRWIRAFTQPIRRSPDVVARLREEAAERERQKELAAQEERKRKAAEALAEQQKNTFIEININPDWGSCGGHRRGKSCKVWVANDRGYKLKGYERATLDYRTRRGGDGRRSRLIDNIPAGRGIKVRISANGYRPSIFPNTSNVQSWGDSQTIEVDVEHNKVTQIDVSVRNNKVSAEWHIRDADKE